MDGGKMKYWVFDLDGTLVDSHSVYFDSLQFVLEPYGANLTFEDKKEVLRIASKDRKTFLAKKIGQENADKALADLGLRLAQDPGLIKPFPGIPELLSQLQKNQAKIGVWTARDLDSATHVLKHTGLDEFSEFCVSSSCVVNCKPDPEGLIKMAMNFGCASSDVIMVGDHDNDMLAAKAGSARGIRAFWNNPVLEVCSLSERQFRQVSSLSAWIQGEAF